jgi:hypothetical protein
MWEPAMNKFVLFAVSASAVLSLAAASAAAPSGYVGSTGIGHSNGAGAVAGGFDAGGPSDRGGASVMRDGRVRCASHNGRLVLVNISGTTFPAHARIRYAVGSSSPRDFPLGAALHSGDAVIVGQPVGEHFDCSAAVLF